MKVVNKKKKVESSVQSFSGQTQHYLRYIRKYQISLISRDKKSLSETHNESRI